MRSFISFIVRKMKLYLVSDSKRDFTRLKDFITHGAN